jgi:hypothetical protein
MQNAEENDGTQEPLKFYTNLNIIKYYVCLIFRKH